MSPDPQVLPAARQAPEARVTASSPVSGPGNSSPAKRGSRALLWVVILAVVAVAGGVAAWVLVFAPHP